MHLLITSIEWDDDGMGLEECALPTNVLMLDVPEPDGMDVTTTSIEEGISETLSDAFGFCHNGFRWERFSQVNDTHAGGGFFTERLGVMRWPG